LVRGSMTAARSPAWVRTCSGDRVRCRFLLGRLTARRQNGCAREPGPPAVTPTVAGVSAAVREAARAHKDAQETIMLALLVAALVPTLVMTAALVLERLERSVLR